jgi:hypothetical protein
VGFDALTDNLFGKSGSKTSAFSAVFMSLAPVVSNGAKVAIGNIMNDGSTRRFHCQKGDHRREVLFGEGGR